MTRESEALYHGITLLSDETVEAARLGRVRKRTPWRRWAAAAAAVVMVAAVGAAALRGLHGGASDLAVRAEYPAMAPYPDESRYLTWTGDLKDSFFKAYDAWWQDVRAQREQGAAITEDMTGFLALSIRCFLGGEMGENRVYSPLNVYMALSLLAETTGGESRQQLLSLLGAASIEDLRAQAAAVWNAHYLDDGVTKSVLASSVWLDRDLTCNSEVLQTLARTYYASSYRGEMGSRELNEALRAWLNEQTGGLLEEQAKDLELDRETLLALAATVYFRAKWTEEFSPSLTKSGTFHAPGGDLTCDFMYQSGSDTYYWGDAFSAIVRPLESGGGMWLLLPDEGVTPEALLEDEEAMAFLCAPGQNWEGKSKHLQVDQCIPKFDIASDTNLLPGLAALGITDLLAPGTADFTPLTDREDLYLSQARHAARVSIDEAGCTAAAYTVMAAPTGEMPPEERVSFTLDRPFLFAITGPTDLPLFTGVVNRPAA